MSRFTEAAIEALYPAPMLEMEDWSQRRPRQEFVYHKRFRPEQTRTRPGWEGIPAVRHGHVHEIKSCDILQPGPAALTDGVRQLHVMVRQWANEQT